MKFSFESQQYRDETAKELMETEKPDRKELLEKKRKTLKYVLMEHIIDFNRKNDKRRKEGSVEEGVVPQETVDKKEIVVEVKPYEDEDYKKEYKVEVETIDISDQIPESVRIVYDMNRLLEVEYSYRDDEVSKGWHKDDKESSDYGYNSESEWHYINRDEDNPIDIIVEKYIKMVEKEKGEPLTKDNGTIIDAKELKKIAEQAKKDFVEFREKMTGGLVSNPNVFYHTIGAYTKGYTGENYVSTMIPEKGVESKLRNRFPNNTDGFEIEEKPLEINEDLISNGLFVHAGELIYDNPLKPLMLIDGASPRFEKQIRTYLLFGKKGHGRFEVLEEILRDANTKEFGGGGAYYGIRLLSKDYRGVHWLGIADQIFDPYHGRMIKIKEIDTTDSNPDPQA